jgi:hypothetical protein
MKQQTLSRLLGVFVSLAFLAATGPVRAHGDVVHAPTKASHGGQLQDAGLWRFELLLKNGDSAAGNTLLVYVTDHDGKPVASAGLTGTATILTGKEKQATPLKPDGENRLKGSASYDRNAKPKIVVSVSGDGKLEQARFNPGQ